MRSDTHTSTGGHVILELTDEELRTLYAAVDREVAFHLIEAGSCEDAADGRDKLAEINRKGRVANRRVAGELRDRAADHKGRARQAGDLRRVLHRLTITTTEGG